MVNVLFLPVVIAFVIFRNKWLKLICAAVWIFCIVVSPDYAIHRLIATAVFFPITYLIVRYVRNRKAGN